jgi:polyketide biosynthesis enoyl-CoA hydratase PksI
VIEQRELSGQVAVIRLEDPLGDNRISARLRGDVVRRLAEAAADPRTKVVVLEGLPMVFCSGADRADLAVGWSPELDEFMLAPARCPLPVVAAVRGAAVGGGLVFALAADVIVMGDTTSVSANFLRYGFTPCGGTTFLLPDRFGGALSTEMMLTGRPYTGRELARRGAGVTVTAREEVEPVAHSIASRIAQAPRDALLRLKKQLGERILAGTSEAIARELPDHRATVGSVEAQQLLDERYPLPQQSRTRHD